MNVNPRVISILTTASQSGGCGFAERNEIFGLLANDLEAQDQWRKTTSFVWSEKNLGAEECGSFLRWIQTRPPASATTPAPARPARAAAAAGAPELDIEKCGAGLSRVRRRVADDSTARELHGAELVLTGRAQHFGRGAVRTYRSEDFTKGH